MSRKRVYKDETLAIMGRFFEMVEILIANKSIRGTQTYCNLYDIEKRHFYAQKKDNGRGYFEIAWILPLIKDFKVSHNWLLFGKGQMFKS